MQVPQAPHLPHTLVQSLWLHWITSSLDPLHPEPLLLLVLRCVPPSQVALVWLQELQDPQAPQLQAPWLHPPLGQCPQ